MSVPPPATSAADGPSNAPPAPVPLALPVPTPAATPKRMDFDGLLSTSSSSDVPYAVAHPTPVGALPQLATARPLNNIGSIHRHLGNGTSNIPVVNGQPQQQMHYHNHQQLPPHLPYIATEMPTGADYEHSPFQFMDKCRWVAAVMLAYYIGTFLFLQPFFMGVVGMLTGFIGYFGARAPMDLVRMKWIRSYIWLNYIMIGLNLWLLAITFLFVGNSSLVADSNSDNDSTNSYMYAGHGLGLLVALLVACNTLIHVRAIQTSHAFYAELVRARLHDAPPAVIVMTNMA